jgi:hypothetical protein
MPPVPILSQMNPAIPSHHISPRFILILSSHQRQDLSRDLFPSGFPTTNLCAFLIFSIRATCPTRQSSWLDQLNYIWWSAQVVQILIMYSSVLYWEKLRTFRRCYCLQQIPRDYPEMETTCSSETSKVSSGTARCFNSQDSIPTTLRHHQRDILSALLPSYLTLASVSAELTLAWFRHTVLGFRFWIYFCLNSNLFLSLLKIIYIILYNINLRCFNSFQLRRTRAV